MQYAIMAWYSHDLVFTIFEYHLDSVCLNFTVVPDTD